MPLQNACVNGGRKISCNMAFCDRREIAKGRKNKKRFRFSFAPLPHDAGKAQEVPIHQEQCEKRPLPFSLVNLAASQAGIITPGRSRAPSYPSWGNEGWASSFHFAEPCCHVPSTTRRDVSPCLGTMGTCATARAGKGSPVSSPSLSQVGSSGLQKYMC